MPRLLRVLFVAYLAATAAHLAIVMAHEPFSFDAWNVAVDTQAAPFSWSRWASYGVFEYAHSNPRLGQWLTYAAYKLTWFAPIATPLAFLALAYAVTILGLGRWPRRGRELALLATAVGAMWFALPRIGMVMFCRAYGANYLYGAAIQLWFLVPLRLARRGQGSGPACVAYAAFGVLAGLCNEHTGPALLAMLGGYAWWRQRSGRTPALAWAGLVGVAIGFAALFFAPGQGSRYDGLATKVSLLGRLLQRGVIGNLDILRDWLLACAPVLALLVIVLIIARRDQPARASDAHDAPLELVGWALAGGTVIAMTLFVSPKLGPRFYLHGAALVLAGWIAVADRALHTTRRLAPFVIVAVLASIYAGARTLPLYLRLDRQSTARLAALAAMPRGGVATVEAFEQIDDSWWFLGDDFRDIKKRELIANYYDLGGVIFRAVDIDAPLGVSDVALVPRVWPADCRDEISALSLGTYRGIDIASVHQAARAAIETLRGRLRCRLERLDLGVQLAGTPPALPRPTLLVERWQPAGYEGYTGAIERKGTTTTRSLKLPRELAGTDAEIYIYQVGTEARRLGTARDARLEYIPWTRGAYWALACRPTDCFVFAAARVL